jgi:hypothetical protein
MTNAKQQLLLKEIARLNENIEKIKIAHVNKNMGTHMQNRLSLLESTKNSHMSRLNTLKSPNPLHPKEMKYTEHFRNPNTKDQMIRKIMTKVRLMTKPQLKRLLTKLNKLTVN